jgi:hypothetical protein
MRYLIGSGFITGVGRLEFSRVWLSNLKRFTNPAPSRIIALSVSGAQLPFVDGDVDEVRLTGDLGGFMDLVEGRKPHKFNGWMGAVLALALISYNDESDFIFVEQDCLCFGDWVQKLYSELGGAGVLFGRKHQTAPWMPCSQSLFMVRHSYIPEFVRLILSTDAQNKEGELGEHKFERMAQEHPNEWKMFSFGYDRERPFNMEDAVFYIQQVTPEELDKLKEKGLV